MALTGLNVNVKSENRSGLQTLPLNTYIYMFIGCILCGMKYAELTVIELIF